MTEINKLIEFGIYGEVSIETLKKIMPNSQPRGNEIIFNKFKLLRIIEKRESEDFYNLIKGLHIIELFYSGFGSPSSTFFFLEQYALKNIQKAKELEKWIIETGGNYYMPKYKIYSTEEKLEKEKQLKQEK